VKEALQIVDEFPESQIFIIPVRLDDCKIKDSRLSEYNRVDLFPDWEQGIQGVLRSLRLEENKSDKEGEQTFINSSGRETMSSSDDKAREFIDKINRGEIGLDSVAVDTRQTDEGGISSTTKRKCGPCNVGKHGECQGRGVCDCDHPTHHQQGQTM
jgi:hypothetical protein